MNTHSIKHAWFPPAIPKRKHNKDLDSESEWPSAYRPLSGPALEPRPTKRLRHLEGGLAELTLKAKSPGQSIAINTSPEFLTPSVPSTTNQIHDAPLDGEAEPYISSIYEHPSPYTGFGSSAASLPLHGEVSEVNTSDEESWAKDKTEEQRMNEMRLGNEVLREREDPEAQSEWNAHEPESGPEKRKREAKDDEHGLEKKGFGAGTAVLDLDSSEDESATHSPRYRRSAFSLSSTSTGASIRPHPQTETLKDPPEFIICPALLSHIPSPSSGIPSILRGDSPSQSVVLYKSTPWETSEPQAKEFKAGDSEDGALDNGGASVQASQLAYDENAMDIDS